MAISSNSFACFLIDSFQHCNAMGTSSTFAIELTSALNRVKKKIELKFGENCKVCVTSHFQVAWLFIFDFWVLLWLRKNEWQYNYLGHKWPTIAFVCTSPLDIENTQFYTLNQDPPMNNSHWFVNHLNLEFNPFHCNRICFSVLLLFFLLLHPFICKCCPKHLLYLQWGTNQRSVWFAINL